MHAESIYHVSKMIFQHIHAYDDHMTVIRIDVKFLIYASKMFCEKSCLFVGQSDVL